MIHNKQHAISLPLGVCDIWARSLFAFTTHGTMCAAAILEKYYVTATVSHVPLIERTVLVQTTHLHSIPAVLKHIVW